MKTAKELARKSWEATGDKEMSQFLGWVMAALRMRGQRVSTLLLGTTAGGGCVSCGRSWSKHFKPRSFRPIFQNFQSYLTTRIGSAEAFDLKRVPTAFPESTLDNGGVS